MDNHYCVPEFETDEDYFMPSTSGLNRMKKSAMVEDEMMELLWQNGQVVVQSQNQKSHGGRKSRGGGSEAVIRNAEAEAEAEAERIRTAAEETARQHVFMQEDEMASWLHYPFDEPEPEPGPEPEPEPEPRFDHRRDIYADLLYHPPFNKATAAAPPREIRTSAPEIRPQPPRSPPQPPARRVDLEGSTMFQNFMQFARLPKAASSSSKVVEESTVVASNDTPMVVPTPRTPILCATPNEVRGTMSRNEGAGTSTTARELTTTCDLTVASSPDGSGASASASADPPLPPPADGQRQPPAMTDDRKRKGREADDNEDNSVGIDFESGETKKHARGSTSTKKSRAAEVHNLSERKRRDRINEKMRALQELIPRCNKSDKASMLDEAIEYLKSLQLQVQMMSMGCSMVPMMYPGVQHYMPAMGMGMGMGMGIDMGMNRPMIPYPHLLPGSAMPNPAAAAHMGPRFPMPAFHIPPVPVPDPSRVQASNASDSTLNSSVSHSVNQPRFPNFVDPYQQYLSLHQGQVPVPQNQAVLQPSTEKPSSSRKVGNPEKHQPGS